MKKAITRRDFMRQSVCVVAGTSMSFSGLSKSAGKKTRVILIRHQDALDENYTHNQVIIQNMLDQAVMKLLDQDDPTKAFKTLMKPDDLVGIKSNVWNYLPTPPQLERAIERRILDAGVKKENLSIDDRGVRSNPIFQKATALINVRPLRTHYLAGLSGCMKNYITFGENWPDYHPNNCANLASLFDLPLVKGKSRLHILCALTPQFHGRGPHHFNRRYVWAYKGLVVGTDPVAVDTVGYKILTAKRKQHFKERYQLTPNPKYMRIADVKYKLGTSDWNKIELIRLGWKDEILV